MIISSLFSVFTPTQLQVCLSFSNNHFINHVLSYSPIKLNTFHWNGKKITTLSKSLISEMSTHSSHDHHMTFKVNKDERLVLLFHGFTSYISATSGLPRSRKQTMRAHIMHMLQSCVYRQSPMRALWLANFPAGLRSNWISLLRRLGERHGCVMFTDCDWWRVRDKEAFALFDNFDNWDEVACFLFLLA